ncbi:MAG: hypothetical protein JWP59_4693 [Massilia sp.]|nr:hypothetical protein [Massilia sp.]
MPDGTSSAVLERAASAPPAAMPMPTPVADDRPPRRDRATAKVVYQAQMLRRALGRRAAYTFMIAKRVPSALIVRILSSPDQQLRR